MKDAIRRLPDAELEVMQAVWACQPPAARADIDKILQETHPMALTTLLTVLSRLADKGFLEIRKEGRSARYLPLVSRQDYLAQQSRRFVEKVCGGSRWPSSGSCWRGTSYEHGAFRQGPDGPDFQRRPCLGGL